MAALGRQHCFSSGELTPAEAVNLDFDLTFVVQMVAFSVLVIILKPLLFDPLMKLFEERERRTEGAKLLARKMDERAGELLQRYETELETVRRAAAEEREKLRAEGQRSRLKFWPRPAPKPPKWSSAAKPTSRRTPEAARRAHHALCRNRARHRFARARPEVV